MKLIVILTILILAVVTCVIYVVISYYTNDSNSGDVDNGNNLSVAYPLHCEYQESPWLYFSEGSSYDVITPVTLMIANVSIQLENEQRNCYSDYFFAKAKDYSNALFFSVTIGDEYASVSVLTHYQVTLYGSIKVEVLDYNCYNSNALCDIAHFSHTYEVRGRLNPVCTHDTTLPCFVYEPHFISLDLLHNRYLTNDTIFFRVSYTSLQPFQGSAVLTCTVDYLLTTSLYLLAACSVYIFF